MWSRAGGGGAGAAHGHLARCPSQITESPVAPGVRTTYTFNEDAAREATRGDASMPRSPAIQWLSKQTRTGIREMPTNAAWALSRLVQPAEKTVGSVAESAAAGGRKAGSTLIDVTPGLGESRHRDGDSVDARMARARESAERARQAEDRAIQAADESRERSGHAEQVSARGRARIAEVERETERHMRQRIAAAEKAAQELVERERRKAEEEAESHRSEVRAEVEEEVVEARREAEDHQRRAEELVADANEKLAIARRHSEEATDAARTAAAEANRRAEQLATEAEEQAGTAEEPRFMAVARSQATASEGASTEQRSSDETAPQRQHEAAQRDS